MNSMKKNKWGDYFSLTSNGMVDNKSILLLIFAETSIRFVNYLKNVSTKKRIKQYS